MESTAKQASSFLLASQQYSPLHVHGGYTSGLSGSLKPQSTEADPNGLTSSSPGAKLDAGKVDILRGAFLYFPKALEAVAQVSEIGAKKYAWEGWRTVPDGVTRYGAALSRHLMHKPGTRDNGPGGTGCLHAAQVAWNALAILELLIEQNNNAV
jgi:hypothetical protein